VDEADQSFAACCALEPEPGSYTIIALTTDEFEGTGSATASTSARTLTTVKATTFSPQSP